MADTNNIFSYTKRDYAGARKEGLSKIPSMSRGVWTDLNATDPGIIILDYVHSLVDMINYYQDHQALEAFIPTAKERANIFRLAKQLSYKIRSAKSARVAVTYHSDFIYNYTIKIPKNTKVSTSDSIEYLTEEDAYLRAGETEVTVNCRQGKLFTKEYKGTGLSRFSNVEPPANTNQSISLTAGNIDTDSITITDNLGRVWEPVDHIVFSDDISRVYQIELNPDDSVTIKFGDGERGMVPQETDVLTVSYLITDAENGRVGVKAISITDPIYNDEGKYIDLSVYNSESSVGGSSSQSSTEIRDLASGAIKAQDRAVTLSDFENLAKLVDGVSDAKAYDINTNPNIPYHEVRVIIIPTDVSYRKEILSRQVYDYLYKRMIPPTNLNVSFPSSTEIDINVVVKKIEGTDSGSLEYTITQTIKEYFTSRSNMIGENFYPTDLSTKIANIYGVKYVASMTPSSIVEIDDLSIATLGNLVIIIQ